MGILRAVVGIFNKALAIVNRVLANLSRAAAVKEGAEKVRGRQAEKRVEVLEEARREHGKPVPKNDDDLLKDL